MKLYGLRIAVIGCAVALSCGVVPVAAQTAPTLGTVRGFAVLGGAAVTAAGAAGTVISGDVGSSPTPTVDGFPPAVVTAGFTVHLAANATTATARADAGVAYTQLAGQVCPPGNIIAGGTLGGLDLGPGVYCMPTANLTGTLTLTGGPSDVWVFQVTLDTLTTAAASQVLMAGGASACNVYWQVSSSATLGSGSAFRGSIFSGVSITLGTNASVVGRVIAGSGAVTLDGSNTVGGCSDPIPVCPPITLSPATLPGGTVGVAYAQTIAGNGGTAPYTFAVTAGTLPPGLTLTAAGVLAGTPTAAGSSTFTVRGTDAAGCVADITYTVVIVAAPVPPPGCPPIALAPATLPASTVGIAYTQTITGSGGTAPYTFGVTTGALPAGLLLTAAGVLAGTPTTAGSSTFTVRGTDAVGCVAEITYTLVVAAAPAPPPGCPPVTLTPATLPASTVGVAYSQTISGSGGTAPYSFGVTSGALPAGLILTAAGLLSGTPTTAGASAFTIRGTDAVGCFGQRPYTMTVLAAVPTLPQIVVLLLASALTAVGYSRLRRRARQG